MFYSFIVPIYNDAALAEDFVKEMQRVFTAYLNSSDLSAVLELIFVNDGSAPGNNELLVELSKKYNFIKIIELSRNFGQHIAVTCGYANALGDLVVILNVDMQDPPEEIPRMLEHLKENYYDIVYAVRAERNDSLLIRSTSYIFHLIFNFLTKTQAPAGVSTLRVANRRFVDAYNLMQEKNRYFPGLQAWLGFNQGYLVIKHNKRSRGKTSYTFGKRLLLAFDSILAFSDFPLKLFSLIGILISLIGFLSLLLLIIAKIFFIDFQTGFTSTISIITFLAGIQIFVTGLVGIYIGKVLREVQSRPLYLIKEKYNFTNKGH